MVKLEPKLPRTTRQVFKAIADTVKETMEQAAKDVQRDYQQTVSTWSTAVDFPVKPLGGLDSLIAPEGAGAQIYEGVDQGTRPHTITPRGRFLKFQTGYRAKTQPGRIQAGSGGSFGAFVFVKRVNHPGTNARRFTANLRMKWRAELPRRLTTAISRALH